MLAATTPTGMASMAATAIAAVAHRAVPGGPEETLSMPGNDAIAAGRKRGCPILAGRDSEPARRAPKNQSSQRTTTVSEAAFRMNLRGRCPWFVKPPVVG